MPAFDSLAGRSSGDINFENAVRHRARKTTADLTNPGMPHVNSAPGWDAFRGGLERLESDAGDAGMGVNVNLSGIGRFNGEPMSAISSLRRAAGGNGGDDVDATDYQMRRAILDRTLNDNFAAKWGQRTALSDADRARDPNLVRFDDSVRNDRLARDQGAADTRATDSFRRLEPTRLLQRREQRQGAEEMLPFNASVLQSRLRNEAVMDTNDARRDVAATNAGGRTGAAAINSLARLGSAQTFGDPAAESRVGAATSAVMPNVPGQGSGLKPFPDEAFPDLVQTLGSPQAADEWLRLNGYARAGAGR